MADPILSIGVPSAISFFGSKIFGSRSSRPTLPPPPGAVRIEAERGFRSTIFVPPGLTQEQLELAQRSGRDERRVSLPFVSFFETPQPQPRPTPPPVGPPPRPAPPAPPKIPPRGPLRLPIPDIPRTPRGILGVLIRAHPILRILSSVILGAQILGAIVGPGAEIERQTRERIRKAKQRKGARELEKTKERLRKRNAERIATPTQVPTAPAGIPAPTVPARLPQPGRVDPTQDARVRAAVRQATQTARERAALAKRARQTVTQPQVQRVQTPRLETLLLQRPGTPTIGQIRVPRRAKPKTRLDRFQDTIGSLPTGQPQQLAQRTKTGRCVCKCKKTRKRKKPRLKCNEGFFRETMWGGEDFTVWRVVDCPPEAPPP